MRVILLRAYLLLLISIFGVFTYSFFYVESDIQIEPQDGYILFEVLDQEYEKIVKENLYYSNNDQRMIDILTSKKNITIV
jgi:hypothetical protein